MTRERDGEAGEVPEESREPVTSGPDAVPAAVAPAPEAVFDSVEVCRETVSEIVDLKARVEGMRARIRDLEALAVRQAVDGALEVGFDPALAVREVAVDIALRARESDRAVERELDQAHAATRLWPATCAAIKEYRIHSGHLRVVAEVGGPIQCPERRAAFEAALLPHADGTNPARLKRIARRLVTEFLDEPLTEQHRAARDRRGVWVRDLDNGMAELTAILPAGLAHGIEDRLTRGARALGMGRGPDADPRTFDQRRADLLCQMLLTAEPVGNVLDGIRAEVSVVIPAEVLLDTDDSGGGTAVARLASGAPIDPETAKTLAGGTKLWNRLFTDPIDGQVIAVDTYRPSKKLRRFLRARDQHCRWPGCITAAVRCDIDHTHEHQHGGKTCLGNLAHFCRRHHTVKSVTFAGGRKWKVTQIGKGVLEFLSPEGTRYTDQPEPVGPVFRETWGGQERTRTPLAPDELPF